MKKLLFFLLCALALTSSSCGSGYDIENEHPEGYGWWSWPDSPPPTNPDDWPADEPGK